VGQDQRRAAAMNLVIDLGAVAIDRWHRGISWRLAGSNGLPAHPSAIRSPL
jgi:hypothetical protein